jgi:predicted small metal-binding protein
MPASAVSEASDSGRTKEVTMERKYIDCREYPSEMNCTIMISADSEAELIEARFNTPPVHNEHDTPELREEAS